eukprot:2323399-Rhodomonas_salina.1
MIAGTTVHHVSTGLRVPRTQIAEFATSVSSTALYGAARRQIAELTYDPKGHEHVDRPTDIVVHSNRWYQAPYVSTGLGVASA